MAIPQPLQRLVNLLKAEVEALTSDLEGGQIEPIYWQREMERALTRYHQAAYMAGNGVTTMDDAALKEVKALVAAQLKFLAAFAIEISAQKGDGWLSRWNSRAASYADAIKVPFWRGATYGIPLPGMPAEGTECKNNCGCSWEIVELDAAAGNYDAYWRRSKQDSCNTCLTREAEWSPVRIRGGELQ